MKRRLFLSIIWVLLTSGYITDREMVVFAAAPNRTDNAEVVRVAGEVPVQGTVDMLPLAEQPLICRGRPEVELNIRDGVWGNVLGQFTARTVRVLRFEARQQDSAGDYWYAFWFNFGAGRSSPRYGWVLSRYITITNQSDCGSLPLEPRLPAGLHLLGFSVNAYQVLAVADAFGVQKGTDGAEGLMAELKRVNPQVITVWRNLWLVDLGRWDCPSDWGAGDPVVSARKWWRAQYATWRARGLIQARSIDYYEYRNECGFQGKWEVAFDREMVRLASRRGVCLALFSDAYGTPEIDQFVRRRPVLDSVLAVECQPGRHHVVSLHTYGNVHSGSWIFGRWLLFRAALGRRYNAIQYIFTEFGITNAAGNNDGHGAPDCGVATREMVEALVEYKKHREVLGFALFSVGGSSEWLDLSPCLPQMAEALRQLR